MEQLRRITRASVALKRAGNAWLAPGEAELEGSGMEGVEHDHRWSDTDRAVLSTSLRGVWDAKPRTPFGGGGSAEVAALMACPRDELRDRTLTVLGGINVVSALLFSGLVSPALNPVDVEEFRATPEGQEQPWKADLWDVQNIAVALATAFSACLTLFTTYLLMQVAVEPTPSGLYRAVIRMSRFLSIIAFVMAVLLWLLVYMLVVALALRSSTAAFRASVPVVLLPCAVFTVYFMEVLNVAFPSAGLTWSKVWWPVGIRATLLADAKRSGMARVREAVALHGAAAAPFTDEDEGDHTPEEPASKEAQELEGALAEALAHTSPARREHLAAALLRAGLTLGVLRAGAAHTPALTSALDSTQDFGATLLPGERLALITYVAKSVTAFSLQR
ncbi:hypothetical protein RI054_12g61790 [Pseudoscourfieldia marina]